MIIKKWGGSAWTAQAIETTLRSLRTTTSNFGSSIETTYVFDTNNKLKPAYLPDSVFGGMKFFVSITGTELDSPAEIVSVIDTIYIRDGQSNIEGMIGSYFIASGDFTVSQVISPTQAGATGRYYMILPQTPAEEGGSNPGSWTLEAGDWWVVTDVTGAGTVGDPYVVKMGTINNTYGAATSTALGIVKLSGTPTNGVTDTAINSDWAYDHAALSGNGGHVPAAGASGQFLKHDGSWGTPSYTTVSVASGTNNGTIKTTINGTVTDNIAVTGLGSAAYTASTAYSASGHTHGNIGNAGTMTDTAGALTTGDSLIVRATGAGNLESTTITFDTTQTTFLRRDGTWVTPTDTNTTALTWGAGTATSGTDKVSFLSKESTDITAAKYTLLKAGTNVTFAVGTAGEVTISSTDTNTTYTAGDGLTLTGTDFDLDYPVYWGSSLPNGEKTGAIGFEG